MMQRHFIGLGTSWERRVEAALAGGEQKSHTGAQISAAVLAETRKAGCKCEDAEHMADLANVGGMLYPGMPVRELRTLGVGCTAQKKPSSLSAGARGVCPRLDKLRRRYDQ